MRALSLSIAMALLAATPAWAQSPQTPSPAGDPYFTAPRAELQHLMQEHPGEPMPDNRAALDAALANDPNDLFKLLLTQKNPTQIYLDLNWERSRIYDGAGFAVSLAYMMDLWRVAPALPADPKKVNGDTPDDVRQTAVAFALYNVAIVSLDGTRCGDSSAPSHRLDQLAQIARPIFIYGRGLTAEQKATAIRVALHVERATAPVRKDDPILCSGGLEEIQQGLAANGNKPIAQSTTPGVVGKTLSVPDAPGYKPTYVAPEVWWPKQQALRPQLEATFTTILTPPAPAPSAASSPAAH